MFEADEASGELRRRGSSVNLQAQPFRLLIVLLEHAGEVVSRETLRQSLWPSNTYVEFDGSLNNALKKLRAALRDSAENPTFIRTLPRRGYRFLAPVTVEERVEDSSSPPQLLMPRVQEGDEDAVATPTVTPRSATGRRVAILTFVFVLLVSIAVASYHRVAAGRERARLAAQSAPVKPRLSVAILAFSNTSQRPRDAWLATGLPEMLTTELAAGEQLRLVSAEEVAQLNGVLPLHQPGTLSKSTLVLIHRIVGADVVVLGSYSSVGSPSGEQIRLDLRLQDTAVGDTIATLSDSGREADVFHMVSQVGARLRERLAVPAMSDKQVAGVQASMPSNTEAERWYAEGLAKLRLFDALGARDSLERAIKADSNYSLAHSALAEAWSDLGYEEKAKNEASQAFALAGKLARKDRLFVEARYRVLNHETDKARAIYQTLFDFFPDDVEYGLLLANAQTQSGKKDMASATIQSLRKLPPPARDDPRIDLAEEFNFNRIGQYKLAHEAAARAVEKARATSVNLLLAQALYRDASDLAFLGDGDNAMAAAGEAKGIYSAAGDQFGVSASLVVIGKVQWIHGQYEATEKIFEQALATDRAIGNQTGAAYDIRYLATCHAMRGDLQGARQLYEQSLALYREVDDREHVAYNLNEIAWVLKGSGNPAGTLKLYDEALAIFRDMQSNEGAAMTLDEKGNTLIFLGELDKAHEACQQALELFRKSGDENRITRTLSDLGNIASLQDKLDESRQAYTEAVAIDRKAGDRSQAASAELGLAEVEEEQGHRAEAKQEINETLSYLHQQKDSNDEIVAVSLLAEIALDEGNTSEAVHEVGIARELLSQHQGWTARYIAEITNARVEAATGKAGDASKSLHAVLAEAQKHHYIHYELEARLALCEIEAKTDRSAARAHEMALEKEAQARGFGMIARKSAALRTRMG